MMNGKTDMFLSNDDIERTILRQGDIVAGIHLLGAINIKSIRQSPQNSAGGQKDAWHTLQTLDSRMNSFTATER